MFMTSSVPGDTIVYVIPVIKWPYPNIFNKIQVKKMKSHMEIFPSGNYIFMCLFNIRIG